MSKFRILIWCIKRNRYILFIMFIKCEYACIIASKCKKKLVLLQWQEILRDSWDWVFRADLKELRYGTLPKCMQPNTDTVLALAWDWAFSFEHAIACQYLKSQFKDWHLILKHILDLLFKKRIHWPAWKKFSRLERGLLRENNYCSSVKKLN